MESVTLVDLGAIIAAILGPMLACMVVVMRYQHKDSLKTRELLAGVKEETRELISESNKETRELISESNKETRQWVTQQLERLSDRLTAELKELGRGLADARDRLARIEGHLGIGRFPPQDETGERNSNVA